MSRPRPQQWHRPMLSTWMAVDFVTLTPMDRRWYRSVTESSTPFFNAQNSAENVDVATVVCLFDCHSIGVDPMNARTPVIDRPVFLSCPWSASTKIFMSSSGKSGVGNRGSIYLYLPWSIQLQKKWSGELNQRVSRVESRCNKEVEWNGELNQRV